MPRIFYGVMQDLMTLSSWYSHTFMAFVSSVRRMESMTVYNICVNVHRRESMTIYRVIDAKKIAIFLKLLTETNLNF